MIAVSNLSIQYGEEPLFKNVDLKFEGGNRYGIIGANGSGKSTLLKILSGEDIPFDGQVMKDKDIVIGHLTQDHFKYEKQRVVDVVIQGNQVLWRAMLKKEKLMAHESLTEADGTEIAHLEDVIAENEGYAAEAKASEILSGLGIEVNKHHGSMAQLSGGFKLRVLLSQVLFQNPDVLALDEPTNHLDIQSIAWLEQYLIKQTNSTLLLVSHDRAFINKVCTHIADVDYGGISLFKGSYDAYQFQKMSVVEQNLKTKAKVEKKIAHMQSFVDRFKAKATKAKQAQSRVKQIEKMDIPDIQESTRRYPDISFRVESPSGKEVLKIRNISKSYGDLKVLNDVSFEVLRGDKVAIIGPNGVGKSTLLKIVNGGIKADQGDYQWGGSTKVGYFAQDYKVEFKTKKKVLDWLYDQFSTATQGKIRGTLSDVLFDSNDVQKSVTVISGGESARLIFARLMIQRNNVIILDEPGNHLDIESIDMLESALVNYEGTLLFVSHDREFIRSIATRIIAINHDSVINHDGDYDSFMKRYGLEFFEFDKSNTSSDSESDNKKTGKNLYVMRKERKKRINSLKTKIRNIENKIEKNEQREEEINQLFADSSLYTNKTSQEINQLQQELSGLQDKSTDLLMALEKTTLELTEVQNEEEI